MRVLLTGGAGFIGSHTAGQLLASGHQVCVLDDLSTGRRENLDGLNCELRIGSITNADQLQAAMRGCTHVVHLAARPGVGASCADPVAFDHVNVHGTVMVFQAARALGLERVVYASSAAVYGSDPQLPVRERDAGVVLSPYAATKMANELYARVFTQTLGLDCVGLRFFNVFGARQDPDSPYSGVVPVFVSRALAGRSLGIEGDGEQTRDFVAVHDVARAVESALTAPSAPGKAYNIGTATGRTVNALAALVQASVEGCGPIEHGPPRPGDVRHSRADVSLAASDLGWGATADFDRAMAETIAWYATQGTACAD